MIKGTAILFALLIAPAFAGYDLQNEAIKQCYENERGLPTALNDAKHSEYVWQCMGKAGWLWCGNCAQYATTLGATCAGTEDGPDRPACWYRKGEDHPTHEMLRQRWLRWIKSGGLKRQQAPYAPDLDPDRPVEVKTQTYDICAGSDWPSYCRRHRDD